MSVIYTWCTIKADKATADHKVPLQYPMAECFSDKGDTSSDENALILFWDVKITQCFTCSADAAVDANEEVWPGGSSRLRSKLEKEKTDNTISACTKVKHTSSKLYQYCKLHFLLKIYLV